METFIDGNKSINSNKNGFKFNKLVLFLGLIILGAIIFSGSVSAAGLANTPQPKFHHDNQNTGQSQYKGPQTNSTKWKFTTGDYISSSPSIGNDGTIYIRSYDRKLYAITPTGTLKWKYTVGDWMLEDSSPAIASDGTIYVGGNDSLYAIKPNGQLKGRYITNGWVTSSPAIGDDGTIYVGSEDAFLYAISPTGALKWYRCLGAGIESSPAIGSDGTIYVGGYESLYAINPTGTVKWEYTTRNWIVSSPAIGKDGTIYVGSRDGNLYAIKPSGILKWKYTTKSWVTSSPAIGNDGTIYVGSDDHSLYAINPTGSLKWKYTTRWEINSSPAIGSDGTIYVGSDDKNLYAIKPNGQLKWRYITNGWVTSSPAIGKDGTIYVGSYDQKLYAIQDRLVFASPKGGYYKTVKMVTLSSSQLGTIFYRLHLHGTYTKWFLYSSPIKITETQILQFFVKNTAGTSGIYTEKYIIDKNPPKISSTSPKNHKTGFSKTKTIRIKFSESIKKGKLYNNIKVIKLTTNTRVPIIKTIVGNTLYIKTIKTRAKNTWYQVIIPKKAIRDRAGNNLKATYTVRFKTIT